MARKRNELGASTEARIVALMKAGGTAESIAAQLGAEGVTASRATIGRRMQELRGQVNAGRAERAAVIGGEVTMPSPESIPDGTPVEEVDGYITRLNTQAMVAEADGDIDSFTKCLRMIKDYMTVKIRLTPPRKPDRNDEPDTIAEGAAAVAKLEKLFASVGVS